MDQKTWVNANCQDFKGKTLVITGATGGIGRQLCLAALQMGGRLILLNRSKEKTDALIKDLLQQVPDGAVSFYPLDLTDLKSVKRACDYLSTQPIDILLHNAAVYDVPRFLCSTGYDNVFETNFLSPYCMTKVLLPHLRSRKARVCVVGSIAHNYRKSDPEDPDFREKKQSPLVYGNSKRYLMFAFPALLKKEPEISFSMGHPGITLTNISNHYPAWFFPIIRPFLKLLFMKPEKACRGILYAMSHDMPENSWAGPRYFHIWGDPKVEKISTAEPSEQQQIFLSAEKMYKTML